MRLLNDTEVQKVLKDNGCYCPSICSGYPYSCGCGFISKAKFYTTECIGRIMKGLKLGTERRRRRNAKTV
jgi:hypothetical protein